MSVRPNPLKPSLILLLSKSAKRLLKDAFPESFFGRINDNSCLVSQISWAEGTKPLMYFVISWSKAVLDLSGGDDGSEESEEESNEVRKHF